MNLRQEKRVEKKTRIEKLQNIFYKQIPITKSIKLEVKSYENSIIKLYAPLKENINHIDTAFGGSLYNLAVLTGWGLVHMILENNNIKGDIVIQDSSIKFLKPMKTNMYAFSKVENQKIEEKFLKIYKRKGISRISLKVEVQDENENTTSVFEGVYVVSN